MNSIWITESEKQLENIELLKPKLFYKEAILQGKCDISALPTYDMVFFLLTPFQIGNSFFLATIEEILRVRRSGKTVILVIDDIHRLNHDERVKVTLELKASVRNLLANPAVFTVSTYYASLQQQYEDGLLSLDEIRRKPDVMVTTEVEGIVMGRQLEAEHVMQLLVLSRMESIYRLLQKFSIMKYTGIDVTKKNWLVTGPDATGKGNVNRMLQEGLVETEGIQFTEIHPVPEDVGNYYDGIVIILDLQMRRGLSYLEQLYSSHTGIDIIIIVNKMDEFMLLNQSRQSIIDEYTSSIRSITNDPIHFVSTFFYEQFLLLEKGELSSNDIVCNPDVVLADALDFPISKEKNIFILQKLLLQQSRYDKLLQTWE